ncbi:MAG: hypothetical protein K2H73_08830 [Treponemataceae bacterium]|nr:hypothetical protein [Treponemataceae bacterium]
MARTACGGVWERLRTKKREVSERNALENLASSTEVDIGESLSAFYKLELF